MRTYRYILVLTILLLQTSIFGLDIKLELSGDGAVNDSTIKVGEKVTFDLYFNNQDGDFRGFSVGFTLTSPDIKTITHPEDQDNGMGEHGDVRAYNGWENKSIWSLGGMYVVKRDWDGKVPELIGFGGISASPNNVYAKQEWGKNISIDLIFDQPGTIKIDSSYFPPSGKWMFAPPETFPTWGGPYEFKVVE